MNHREQRQLDTEKRTLREAMRARRMQLPHAAMLGASQSVARHFADHPILAFAPGFAGYRAMRGELDVMAIFALMARYDKQTALPCLTADGALLYRAWKPGDPLIRHPLGMEEPTADAAPVTPAIILVPLLAFDGAGYRLGYGGGYYDRSITTHRALEKPPLFIGVAYSLQEVAHVPTDAHDQPLDGILTELGVSMF
ncbi:MAG: 5-formyltetrahydrofolate cyclo-ligase [Alphaproteobacteria bacterium]|nr:5-formyltetrahydrofolate cyclo-ligase [Alphaproteobacteria bacterium]